MEQIRKQPYEEFTISADFSANMASGEVISVQSVAAVDKTGNDVKDTVTDQATVANDGKTTCRVLVKGGDPTLSPYTLTFRCTTSLGNKWELDIQMQVLK